MTSAVQLGFIAGTLVFSFFALADSFSPRAIFLASAVLGAACTAATCLTGAPLWLLLLRRFATEAAREEARMFCDEIARDAVVLMQQDLIAA